MVMHTATHREEWDIQKKKEHDLFWLPNMHTLEKNLVMSTTAQISAVVVWAK